MEVASPELPTIKLDFPVYQFPENNNKKGGLGGTDSYGIIGKVKVTYLLFGLAFSLGQHKIIPPTPFWHFLCTWNKSGVCCIHIFLDGAVQLLLC